MAAPHLSFLLVALATAPVQEGAGSLEVRLAEPVERGSVRVALHGDASSFEDLGRPAYGGVFAPGQAIVLEGLEPGLYGLVVHHDENGNGKLDQNFLGIPNEPVGFAGGYRPLGPPRFERSLVSVEAGAAAVEEVALARPLGERGTVGVGVGAVVQALPYRGATGVQVQPIPLVTYLGDRLAILGPGVTWAFSNGERSRLLGTVRARFGVYDEDDAPILEGLGDRDTVPLVGARWEVDLARGLELSVSAEGDVFDVVGGGEAAISLARPFRVGDVDWTPSVGIRWAHQDLVAHDFGVPASAATPERPAYDPDDTTFLEVGLGMRMQLSDHVQLLAIGGLQALDDEVTDSPLVDEDVRGSLVLGLVYTL